MGHLDDTEFGVAPGANVLSSTSPALALSSNFGRDTSYWSGTPRAPDPGGAVWTFDFSSAGASRHATRAPESGGAVAAFRHARA